MIFPIGDDQVKGGAKPIISYAFIAMNVVIWIYEFSLGHVGLQQFTTEFGSIPAEIARGEDYHTLFTSMFMHGSWMHMLSNMMFLWVFGDNIEATIGNISYFFFYILGGLTAFWVHAYFSAGSNIPTVGASGAIAAILGAYIVMFPKSQIKILFIIKTFYMSAFYFLGLWIAQQFFSVFTSGSAGGGIAWWAHIGGFAFGALCGLFFRSRHKSELIASGRT